MASANGKVETEAERAERGAAIVSKEKKEDAGQAKRRRERAVAYARWFPERLK